MEHLHQQWIEKAPNLRYTRMIGQIPTSHEVVTCDSRLRIILERSIEYWARTINRFIPKFEGSNATIIVFRLLTRVKTIMVLGNHPYDKFVLRKFQLLLTSLQESVRSNAGQNSSLGPFQMGTSQFVNDELFMEAFSTFLACKDYPPEFREMVDCSYDVAVDAFSWPTST